jgi:curved DNA-binding protein CbpA
LCSLQVDDDADAAEIKKAYRALAKECHPDYLGDKGHNICILLNEAYETLTNEDSRRVYNAKLETALADEEDAYTGQPLSKWIPSQNPAMAKNANPQESRGVFVDENTCIGCKQCVWHAPATFRIEPEYGRSRAFAQWLDKEDDLQAAIGESSCMWHVCEQAWLAAAGGVWLIASWSGCPAAGTFHSDPPPAIFAASAGAIFC